jgi:hypothetical protein
MDFHKDEKKLKDKGVVLAASAPMFKSMTLMICVGQRV